MVIASGKKGESDYELQHGLFLDERPYLDETSRRAELYILLIWPQRGRTLHSDPKNTLNAPFKVLFAG
jgi:hypothetical protein